jgi:hypothetical protein
MSCPCLAALLLLKEQSLKNAAPPGIATAPPSRAVLLTNLQPTNTSEALSTFVLIADSRTAPPIPYLIILSLVAPVVNVPAVLPSNTQW